MRVFEEADYKLILKERIRELGKSQKGFNLRKIAERVGIQYTYLSRLLNDEKYHLNEDQLFLIGERLEFFPEEMTYLSLLRARAASSVAKRKEQLDIEIEQLRNSNKLEAPIQTHSSSRIHHEMEYLLEPLAIIVHSSLEIPFYFKNPKLLCAKLDIPLAKLKLILEGLDRLGFIELAPNGLTILKLGTPDTHYGTDHPLMRSHQNLLRQLSAAQIMKSHEEDRQNFMVTFTGDDRAFEEIRKGFQAFLKSVERTVRPAKNERTYQLNFDLFKWL